jgi:pimeloyl-ACP methyl ester carboxylesterase
MLRYGFTTRDGRDMSAEAGFDSVFTTSRDGLRLHTRVYGDRHHARLPLVCLPGLARNSIDFHALALALSTDAKAPRRVLALDYRGRGLSDYDANWKNYDIRVELDDVLQVLTSIQIEHAVFCGTSRGGLITMALSAARPTAIKGVILNDIGPVIDAAGLLRIRSYVGKLPAPRDYVQGVEILRRIFGAQFPIFNDAEWIGMAHGTWKETPRGLVPDYDTNLLKGLEALDLEAPLPILWTFFEGLKNVPMLVLRGENSDLLSAATLDEMGKRHPRCETLTLPGQGHAPLLGTRDMIARVQRLIARAEAG